MPEPLPESFPPEDGLPEPLPESPCPAPLPVPGLSEPAFPAGLLPELPDAGLPPSALPDGAWPCPGLPDDALPGSALPPLPVPAGPLPVSDFGPDESGFEPDGCCEPPPLDEPPPGFLTAGESAAPDPDEAGEPDEPDDEAGFAAAGAGADGGSDSTAGGSGAFVVAAALSVGAGVSAAGAAGAAVAAGAAAAAGTAASAAHFAFPSPFPEPHESATATPDVSAPNAAAANSAPTNERPSRPGLGHSRREPALRTGGPQKPTPNTRIRWQDGSHRRRPYPARARKDRGANAPTVDRSPVHWTIRTPFRAVERSCSGGVFPITTGIWGHPRARAPGVLEQAPAAGIPDELAYRHKGREATRFAEHRGRPRGARWGVRGAQRWPN